MAESGWWSAASELINNIKQHSEQAYHATRRDLTELVITVQADTSDFVGGATSHLGGYLWNRGDNDGIKVNHGDDNDDSMAEEKEPQFDHDFCKEPDSPEFEQWRETFTLEQYTDQISELLAENSEVRRLHSTLVPSMLSNADFWQRYFFRQHLSEQEQQQKQKLITRADASSDHDDLDSWEEIDENCLKDFEKDSEKDNQLKSKLKESEVDEDWISWDD